MPVSNVCGAFGHSAAKLSWLKVAAACGTVWVAQGVMVAVMLAWGSFMVRACLALVMVPVAGVVFSTACTLRPVNSPCADATNVSGSTALLLGTATATVPASLACRLNGPLPDKTARPL